MSNTGQSEILWLLYGILWMATSNMQSISMTTKRNHTEQSLNNFVFLGQQHKFSAFGIVLSAIRIAATLCFFGIFKLFLYS
jgi:hypothetical protein